MKGKIIKKKQKAQTTEEAIAEYGQTFGINTDKEGWVGEEMQTKSVQMIDPGVGRELVIRAFEFSRNPEFKGTLTKQELFNMHWRQIGTLLWSDGLRPYEGVNPRIEFKGNKYIIFITAEPNLRNVIIDKAVTLQDLSRKR